MRRERGEWKWEEERREERDINCYNQNLLSCRYTPTHTSCSNFDIAPLSVFNMGVGLA